MEGNCVDRKRVLVTDYDDYYYTLLFRVSMHDVSVCSNI